MAKRMPSAAPAEKAAVEWLFEQFPSVHLVKINASTKRPATPAWREEPITPKQATRWLGSPRGVLAVVPATMELVAVDLDYGTFPDDAPVPVAEYETKSSTPEKPRYHRFYRVSETLPQVTWQREDARGEFRSDRGFIILWQWVLFVDQLQKQLEQADVFEAGQLLSVFPPIDNQRPPNRPCDRDWPIDYGQEGNRHQRGLELIGHYVATSDDETMFTAVEPMLRSAWIAQHPGEDDAEAEYEQILEHCKKGGFGTEPTKKPRPRPTGNPQSASQPIPEGESENSPITFLNILRQYYDIELRYNQRLLCNEYRDLADEQEVAPWKRNVDSWRNKIRLQLWEDWHYLKPGKKRGEVEEAPWNISREKAADWSDMVSQKRVEDDCLLWFDELNDQWDQTPRIEQTLQDHLGADNTELVQWASAFQFVGCVLAVRSQGVQRRGIITLIGQQFSGKTTWILCLLPEHLRRYAAAVSLAGDDETRSHKIAGMAIVELGELAGASRADNDALKSWLTRARDYVRLPWRRDPEEIERSGLLMASINENQRFPEDASGSTRWVGIQCPDFCNVEAIPESLRRQWWAEAVAVVDGNHPTLKMERYEKGIPRDLLKEQAEANSPFERRDETVENMLTEAAFEIGHKAKAIDIAKQIEFLPRHYADGTTVTTFGSQREQREFTAELEKNGWVKARFRVEGKIIEGWKFQGK